jgi:hypothetical protein
MGWGVRSAFVAALTLVCLAAGAAPAGAAFRIGFFDPIYNSPDPAERTAWFDRTVSVGGSIVRIMPAWAGIAPTTRPVSFKADDPADPAYNWKAVDDAVRDASARGLDVVFTLSGAPTWAQGPGRPADAGGSWRPDPVAYAAFATAAAKRYSGSFADPEHPGSTLPRIRYWQMWNEPNLATNLQPQWVKHGRGWEAASPGIYRALLNEGYAAVKAVDRSNFVVGAGTAPYGDLAPGGRRIAPVTFLRLLFARPTYLDAISHHPYGVGDPLRHALNPADVAVPDLGKLRRVLTAGQRTGKVLPRGPKRFWVTEVSWDSAPPDPQGVPEALHARWTEQALWVLWRAGVDTITWFQIRDQAPEPSYRETNQSGVFFIDGRPKLAATAFRFPFVASRQGRTMTRLWGRSPVKGALVVEEDDGGSWRRIWGQGVHAGQVFHGSAPGGRHGDLRARVGTDTSLVWHQR